MTKPWTSALVLLLAAMFAAPAFAQTPVPQPLPPEVQEALNRGVTAAKAQDYLLAIRYFEEARKLAANAPEVFYNLGLAESKIPGRELRAMAWFGAYLAANPKAPNAAAIRNEIEALDVRVVSTISRLIRQLQDLYAKKYSQFNPGVLQIAGFWAEIGDPQALQMVRGIMEGFPGQPVASSYAEAGYFEQAKSAIQSCPSDWEYGFRYTAIYLAKAGDVPGALEVLNRWKPRQTDDQSKDESYEKNEAVFGVAVFQVARGDVEGSRKTAALISPGSPLRKKFDETLSAILKDPDYIRREVAYGDYDPWYKPVLSASDWTALFQCEGGGMPERYMGQGSSGLLEFGRMVEDPLFELIKGRR
jgi:tetratricopeptide (TPR) repeat protein